MGIDPSSRSCIHRIIERARVDSKDALKQHLLHPEVSLDAYLKAERLALGRKTASKMRVYLDTKYWIYCLDALARKPQRPVHGQIANSLIRLVESGRLVCPLHYALYGELGKIGDVSRRVEMARLFDLLSQGTAMTPPHRQYEAELLHLVRSFHHNEKDLHPLVHLVWQPVAYILGVPVPQMDGLPKQKQVALQKAWWDFFARLSLEDLLKISGGTLPKPHSSILELPDLLNEGARSHRHEYMTFEEVFLIEVAGTLDALKPRLLEAFRYLAQAAGCESRSDPVSTAEEQELVGRFCAVVQEAFRRKTLSSEWPSLHIRAGIHAAIRYENREYRKGDFYDHLHAQAALPYCDLFLTDRCLGTLITGKYLSFDALYDCQVLWDDLDVLRALEGL